MYVFEEVPHPTIIWSLPTLYPPESTESQHSNPHNFSVTYPIGPKQKPSCSTLEGPCSHALSLIQKPRNPHTLIAAPPHPTMPQHSNPHNFLVGDPIGPKHKPRCSTHEGPSTHATSHTHARSDVRCGLGGGKTRAPEQEDRRQPQRIAATRPLNRSQLLVRDRRLRPARPIAHPRRDVR